MNRTSSALSTGFRPVRALFVESRLFGSTVWTCRLCEYTYTEVTNATGWPLTLDGLYLLVKHVKNHAGR